MRVFLSLIAALTVATLGSTRRAQAASPPDSGVWSVSTVAAAPVRAPHKVPADEYFGPMRLSNLGIRSVIHDMVLEGTSPLALPQQLERIDAVDAAFGELITQYPNDDWLPSEMNEFAAFLDSKQVPFAENLASTLYLYVVTRFPHTRDGRNAAAMLATYRPTPPFDMSSLPTPWLHASVDDFVFPKLRRSGRP